MCACTPANSKLTRNGRGFVLESCFGVDVSDVAEESSESVEVPVGSESVEVPVGTPGLSSSRAEPAPSADSLAEASAGSEDGAASSDPDAWSEDRLAPASSEA